MPPQTFPTTGYGYVYTLNPERAKKVREAFLSFPWEGSTLKREFKTQPPHPRDGEHEEWLREQALRYAKAQATRAGIAA